MSDAVGYLGDILWDAGSAIMDGFWNGISSGWSWVQSQVSGFGD